MKSDTEVQKNIQIQLVSMLGSINTKQGVIYDILYKQGHWRIKEV